MLTRKELFMFKKDKRTKTKNELKSRCQEKGNKRWKPIEKEGGPDENECDRNKMQRQSADAKQKKFGENMNYCLSRL